MCVWGAAFIVFAIVILDRKSSSGADASGSSILFIWRWNSSSTLTSSVSLETGEGVLGFFLGGLSFNFAGFFLGPACLVIAPPLR